MKKIISLLLVVVMMAAMVVGCGSTEEVATEEAATEEAATEEAATEELSAMEELLAGKGDGLVVGVCMGDLSSTYIVAASEYFKTLMETAGAEVTVVNCDGDANLQYDQITDFVTMDVDIIMIHANDPSSVAPAVQSAVDAGITCVGFNKSVDGGNLNFEVYSSDNVSTGAAAAEWIALKAEEEGVENAKVAVMQGTMTATDAYLRQDGIEAVAEEYGLELIDCPSNWSSDESASNLVDVLTANPDLYGIITHSDCMTAGVISALKQAGYTATAGEEGHIYFVGIDCDETGISALESGMMDVNIEQSPLALATILAKGCLEVVANGETLNGEITEMDTTVVTADMTGDSDRWAIYDLDGAELWDGTEATWNAYLTDY